MSYGSFAESSGEWLEDECRYEFDDKPDGVVLIVDGKRLVFVPERTCKPDDNGRCSCGTRVIAFKSINPPVTRYYDYCPHCGAKVVE